MNRKRAVKQKTLPEDFRVEEISGPLPTGGPHALYRLSKRGLGTPEAIDAVLRRWKIARAQVSCGGLKDRHAVTAQSVTIRGGPRRDLKQTGFELVYQGQVARPFGPKDILGNQFQIVLRNLSGADVDRARRGLAAAGQDGLPNYFDQQRFGSVGQSGDFAAQAWCAGDFERALWLVLADPNPHDRPRQRAERELVRGHWGDWAACGSALARSPWRDVLAHLVDRPCDFRGALARLRPDLRSLHLAAFQSFLWNRMLAEMIRGMLRPEQLIDVSLGRYTLPFFRELDGPQREALRGVELPLPSARIRRETGPWQELIDRALEPLGLSLGRLRIKYPRDSFLSKGNRAAVFFPRGLEHGVEPDEVHPGRQRLTVRFELSRGCYATILTRRITLG
jgi:tRNA pseudouridine13 synthase